MKEGKPKTGKTENGAKLKKKGSSLKTLIGTTAAFGALYANHVTGHPAEQAIQQARVEIGLAGHPDQLLQLYTRNPYAIGENDIHSIAEAMKKAADRSVVWNVFRALTNRAEVDRHAVGLMDLLEEEARLSASEILFLHRTEYIYDNSDTRGRATEARVYNDSVERADYRLRTFADLYTEQIFDVLRSHPELGALEERAHLALLVNRELINAHETNNPIGSYTYDDNVSISFETIVDTIAHIRAERERNNALPVFNPTIVAFYANEKDAAGNDSFGTATTRDRLNRVSDTMFEFRATGTESDAERIQVMLRHIEDSTTPITVVFDSHGGPDGLYMNQHGAGGSTLTLSGFDLAQALERRYQDHPELLAQARQHPDTIVLLNCHGGEVIATIESTLANRGLLVPGMISASEYDRLGYSSDMFDALFYGPAAHVPTFGDAIEADNMPRPFGQKPPYYGDFMVLSPRGQHHMSGPLPSPRFPLATDRNTQLSEGETAEGSSFG